MLISLMDGVACQYPFSTFTLAYMAVRRAFVPPALPNVPSPPVRNICVFFANGDPRHPHEPAMGDILLRRGFLKLLADRYPAARISVVAGPNLLRRHGPVLTRHSGVHELVMCPEVGRTSLFAWMRFLRSMRFRRFDLCIIDPDSVTVRGMHAYLCGVPQRIGMAGHPLDEHFLTSVVVLDPFDGPFPDLLARASSWAKALGAELSGVGRDFIPRFPFTPEPGLLPLLPSPAVAVHVGGDKSWNRRWPLEKYAQLCDRLCSEAGASIYLVGGADDGPECEHVRAHVVARHPMAHISNVSGATLNQTANYLSRAALFIGNDSGPMHLAAALRTPVVVPMGPTISHMWERVYDGQPVRADPSQFPAHPPEDRDPARKTNCPTFRCAYSFDEKNPVYPQCLAGIPVEAMWSAVVDRLKRRSVAQVREARS
jgi:ADP-heptose:LPS heptosyltransferase